MHTKMPTRTSHPTRTLRTQCLNALFGAQCYRDERLFDQLKPPLYTYYIRYSPDI